jgi:putative transcriptional regulator
MIHCRLNILLGTERISQAECARRTELSPVTINALYHDEWEQIARPTIDKLCKGLDCEVSDLFEYTPNEPGEWRKTSKERVNIIALIGFSKTAYPSQSLDILKSTVYILRHVLETWLLPLINRYKPASKSIRTRQAGNRPECADVLRQRGGVVIRGLKISLASFHLKKNIPLPFSRPTPHPTPCPPGGVPNKGGCGCDGRVP